MSNKPVVGLREANKAKRRNAVLDAAVDLLDRTDGIPVTTERIAEAAEVAAATVYNLVGTREQLLMALLDRIVSAVVGEALDTPSVDDPIDVMRKLATGAVAVLTARPVAYRKVVLELTATANPALHTRLSAATAIEVEFRRAQERSLLRGDLSPRALADQAYLSFNGALLRWAAGALTDTAFRAAALHGLMTVLAASATPKTRRLFVDDLRALGAELVP